jgi:hypothetical protein
MAIKMKFSAIHAAALAAAMSLSAGGANVLNPLRLIIKLFQIPIRRSRD